MSNREKSANGRKKPNHSMFTLFANHTARAAGHHFTFTAAVLIILTWAVTGPIFGYSDTWQLVINTGTTIVTFLMVFLIQNTQNRDSTALHLKIDEIIRALDSAQNSVIDLEDLEEEDLEQIHKRYKALAERAQNALQRDEIEQAAEQIEELTATEQGNSARRKQRAERNRKRG